MAYPYSRQPSCWDLLVSMAAVRLPSDRVAAFEETEALQIELEKRSDIEASLTALGGRPWLRLSAAVYNDFEELLTAGACRGESYCLQKDSGGTV